MKYITDIIQEKNPELWHQNPTELQSILMINAAEQYLPTPRITDKNRKRRREDLHVTTILKLIRQERHK